MAKTYKLLKDSWSTNLPIDISELDRKTATLSAKSVALTKGKSTEMISLILMLKNRVLRTSSFGILLSSLWEIETPICMICAEIAYAAEKSIF